MPLRSSSSLSPIMSRVVLGIALTRRQVFGFFFFGFGVLVSCFDVSLSLASKRSVPN